MCAIFHSGYVFRFTLLLESC